MASNTRLLSFRLLSWLSDRLVASRASGASGAAWPPSQRVLQALLDGRYTDALRLPDKPRARFVVSGRLRPDVRHLFLARDRHLERDVVIKLVLGPRHKSQLAVINEAKLIARLDHPNVVAVYEVDPDANYLVLERLDGDMRDFGSSDPAQVLDAFSQAGRALAFAHAHGVIHGDLRPENILFRIEKDQAGARERLRVKVTDFGCSLLVEQRCVANAHAAKDQHAFAVALWECLTGGRRPPDGEELIPGWLHAVLGTALMLEPSQRWADLTALVDALDRGRETAAAASRAATGPSDANTNAVESLELAIAHAEDGLFALARQHWREVQRRLAGAPGERGRAGFALGAALFHAARRAAGESKQLGYRRCLDVLEHAISSLTDDDDHQTAHDASLLAAQACDAWKTTYATDTTEHQHLDRLATAYRERT